MELVPIPAVLSAPYAGVQLSEEAARAPGRGLQQAGRSIMEAGSHLEELGQRVAKAKATVDLMKAEREMKAAKQRFNEWTITNPDESQWEKRSREEVAKAKQNIGALKLSRDAQTALMPSMMAFEQDFPTEVRFAAIDKQVKRARVAIYAEAEDDAKSGFFGDAQEKILAGVRDGVIDAKEGKLKERELWQVATVSYIQKGINTDPLNESQRLDAKDENGKWAHYTDLSESDRLALSRSAANAVGTMHAETAQGIAEQIYAGDNIGVDVQIDAAVKGKKILPSQAYNLKKALVGKYTYAEQAVDAGKLWEEIDQLKAGDPATKIKAINIRAATAAMDPVIRAPLLKALEDIESPSATKQSRNFGNEHIDALFDGGVLGNTLKEMGEPIDGAQFVAASEERLRLKIALQKFIAENPDGDQIEFLNKQVRQRTTAAGGTGVLNSLTTRKKR